MPNWRRLCRLLVPIMLGACATAPNAPTPVLVGVTPLSSTEAVPVTRGWRPRPRFPAPRALERSRGSSPSSWGLWTDRAGQSPADRRALHHFRSPQRGVRPNARGHPLGPVSGPRPAHRGSRVSHCRGQLHPGHTSLGQHPAHLQGESLKVTQGEANALSVNGVPIHSTKRQTGNLILYSIDALLVPPG